MSHSNQTSGISNDYCPLELFTDLKYFDLKIKDFQTPPFRLKKKPIKLPNHLFE